MPINGAWFNPGIVRCYRKKRYPSWDLAEIAADKASQRTGELIIAYECPDCHKFHIGHADKSQLIIRQPTEPRKAVPTDPAVLPTACIRCGNSISEERRKAAEQSRTVSFYCSRKCQQKASQKAWRARRAARKAGSPEILKPLDQ